MNATIGNLSLVIALSCTVLTVVVLGSGVRRGQLSAREQRVARGLVLGNGVGILASVVTMQVALLSNDTSVRYVADHGSSLTPFPFDVATMWSALGGSILLWGLILAGFFLAVAWKFRERLDDQLVMWALIVMAVVMAFFIVLMLGPAAVFEQYHAPVGFDGPGPNPLLQNHILVAFHPPMLYLGYVGFTVPFAFAIAALITGRVGEGWLTATRRWTLIAWAFLTVGIVLGAWWSYEVSGWGGYWAWDPVENASFLPWLTGTAYLHSVMVQERRGLLRVWNITLLCSTFALTILGTFLTRSGVVQSVHAFAEGSIGPVLLGAFAVICLVSVGLIGYRGDLLRSDQRIDSLLSRESAFLANNLLFGVFAFVVLLGTVFPLIVEAVNGDRLSVGAPFFDQMTTPIGLVMLFLMAVAPVLPWRGATGPMLGERLWWPAVGSVGFLAIAVALGARGWAVLLAYWMAGFAMGSVIRQLWISTKQLGVRGVVGRSSGGMVVHCGVILIAVALVASQSAKRQGEFTLAPGESAKVAGHEFQFLGVNLNETPVRREIRAQIRIDGGQIFEPSMNLYVATGQRVARPSVDSRLTADLYLSLTKEPSGSDQTATIRAVVEPMVMWLWIGGGLMAFGTLLAVIPNRRRTRVERDPAEVGS